MSKNIEILELLKDIKSCELISNWYKVRQITKDMKCVNSFILIDPTWFTAYAAHILPMEYFDEIDVPESEVVLLEPELLVEWYKVESGQLLYTMNFTSPGQ